MSFSNSLISAPFYKLAMNVKNWKLSIEKISPSIETHLQEKVYGQFKYASTSPTIFPSRSDPIKRFTFLFVGTMTSFDLDYWTDF